MDSDPLELTIQMVDLRELQRINPMAWEQLLHIVDNRQNAERISELEEHLSQAHKYAQTRAMATVNGHDASKLDETVSEPA